MLILYLLFITSAGECIDGLPNNMIDNSGNSVVFFVAENKDGMCVPHGKWIETYPSGRIRMRGEYTFGKKSGRWLWRRHNGSLEKIGEYKNNKESGHWEFYNNSGNLVMDGYFCSGDQCSKWRQWWPNGIIRSDVTWQSGKINGEATYYYDNGQVSAHGYINQDHKIGVWVWFDNFGNVVKRKNFD